MPRRSVDLLLESVALQSCSILLSQALIDYYQKNTLEKIFPEVKTSLQIPYKDACKCCWLLFLLFMFYDCLLYCFACHAVFRTTEGHSKAFDLKVDPCAAV